NTRGPRAGAFNDDGFAAGDEANTEYRCRAVEAATLASGHDNVIRAVVYVGSWKDDSCKSKASVRPVLLRRWPPLGRHRIRLRPSRYAIEAWRLDRFRRPQVDGRGCDGDGRSSEELAANPRRRARGARGAARIRLACASSWLPKPACRSEGEQGRRSEAVRGGLVASGVYGLAYL